MHWQKHTKFLYMAWSCPLTKAARIWLSAGEASADFHGAALVKALKTQYPELIIEGVAGPMMQAAGCLAIVDMQELNVMGIVDVVRALPRILAAKKRMLEHVRKHPPMLAFLLDYPGLHMRIGQAMRRENIPVIQYIAPKLWAWGAWRVKRLRRSQDILASILPFEEQWYAQHGIKAAYVGNPSAYACRFGWHREQLCAHTGLQIERPILAILPGSRRSELKHHQELMCGLLKRLKKDHPNYQVIVPVAPHLESSLFDDFVALGAVLVARESTDFALRVDAAVAVSGTATLELALWDTPTVLTYKTSPITAWLAWRLVKLRYVGLANILLQHQQVMPELIQEYCTLDAVQAALWPLLEEQSLAAAKQRQAFKQLRHSLGTQNPADGLASLAASYLSGKQET